MKPAFPGFSPAALKFLRNLEENNTREWFQPRKAEFEQLLRDPMLQLVEVLNTALAQTAPNYVTDPKKAVMRIYRDTRFSHDKTPYKNNVAASFSRRGMEESGGAGLYFSLSATQLDVGGGLYHPPAPLLLAVRTHIAETTDEFRSLIANPKLQKRMGGLTGEELSRPPKGFSPEHPGIDLLKKKDWVFFAQLEAAVATTSKLAAELASRFEVLAPVLDYLNRPLLGRQARAKSDPLSAHF